MINLRLHFFYFKFFYNRNNHIKLIVNYFYILNYKTIRFITYLIFLKILYLFQN